MLTIKPNCESCGIELAPNSLDAMICSFECTFCKRCAETRLHNTCPNCGGGFERRPIRPAASLQAYPASEEKVSVGVDQDQHLEFLRRYRGLPPERR
jgi:hypothetical protein